MSDSTIKCDCGSADCNQRMMLTEEGLKVWRQTGDIQDEMKAVYFMFSIEDNLKVRKYLRGLIEKEMNQS